MNGWLTVLQVGGLAGVVSAVCTFALGIVRERLQSKRDAAYTALRASLALEGFAAKCLDIILLEEVGLELGGRRTKAGSLPSLADLMSDAGWRSVDPDLSDRALGFANQIEGAQLRINAAAFESEDFHRHEIEAAMLGDKAWKLAAELRSTYSLPPNRALAEVGTELGRYARKHEAEAAAWSKKSATS